MALTGLQKEVLKLYRACLRASRSKLPEYRKGFEDFTRAEFRKHLSLNRKDFTTIEYLLRAGNKKLDTMSADDVKRIF
ncbi:hypothetical protein BJ508DRAFT_360581 [Ascobolus immersus RN42]|uniref:Complex 1 LYR protein domain-containing protein n=1 Tax=Ascobolus immersus RN42 TaxID=1160509 RepID=A0A3N4IFA6_ASCIM|nr:hypothetical protein BJ508DRAFT_360581 [Ascobolus immersus RN42]